MKILLALTVSIIVIFGSLLLVGYAVKQIEETSKQIEETASNTADSIYIIIFGWISANQGFLVTIIVFGFFALLFLYQIWPRSPPPSSGAY